MSPSSRAAHPRCVSRDLTDVHTAGNPERIEDDSIGVPFGRNCCMSSCGTTIETTPLFPWRPAILSPTWILRVWATFTLILFEDASWQFVASYFGEDLDADNFSTFATREAKRAVFNIAGFVTEDRAKKPFFCGKFGFHLLE